MSAIANLYLCHAGHLENLEAAANQGDSFYEFLDKNTEEQPDYPWSGYVFDAAFAYLSEEGVELVSNHAPLAGRLTEVRECTCMVYSQVTEESLEAIGRVSGSVEKLDSYCEDLMGDPGGGEAMQGALFQLRSGLQKLDEDSALIVIVG